MFLFMTAWLRQKEYPAKYFPLVFFFCCWSFLKESEHQTWAVCNNVSVATAKESHGFHFNIVVINSFAITVSLIFKILSSWQIPKRSWKAQAIAAGCEEPPCRLSRTALRCAVMLSLRSCPQHCHTGGREGTEDSSSHTPGTLVMASSDQYILRFSLINQESFADLNSPLPCTEVCFPWDVSAASLCVAVAGVCCAWGSFLFRTSFAVSDSQFICLFPRPVYCKQHRISWECFSELGMITLLQFELCAHAVGEPTLICKPHCDLQFAIWTIFYIRMGCSLWTV